MAAFRGRGWAIAALVAMDALWGWRWTEREKAVQLALAEDYNGAEVLRVDMNPSPVNPFRWHAVVETPMTYQLATVDTMSEAVTSNEHTDVLYKPPTTLATLVAKRSWLGEAYLDWSKFPFGPDRGTGPEGLRRVGSRALRFIYDTWFLSGGENPPLSGKVYLNADRAIVRMEMDGRVQR